MGNRWFYKLFRRRLIISILIILQAAFLSWLVASGSTLSHALNTVLRVLSLLAVLYIVSKGGPGSFKTLWVILILSFPIFGGLLYMFVKLQSSTRKMQDTLLAVRETSTPLFALPGEDYNEAKMETGNYFPQVRYLRDTCGFPVCKGTQTQYYCPGEVFWAALLDELEKAEHYIFLEYFLIQHGVMWDSILDVLRRKAAKGVKVRIIYDDLGCFFLLPADYPAQLTAMGIECGVFNPFHPLLTAKQNNRDHRKIAVIDGKIAFTGGINLADEYVNAYEKFGHWKDSAVKVEGKAAWSFTLMFLEMWQSCKQQAEDLMAYYPWKDKPCPITNDGFVLPYCDSPMDAENVSEQVYLQILNQAQDYVYINTPYLIIDDSMVAALCLAAKRGVDVRIVTPHKWDKWAIHMTTRSYYRELIRGGVKIYEYSKGFVHAKSFVSDDKIATVGTANLDYRSLYHHFECGTWMYGSQAVMQLKQDYVQTLKSCKQITLEDCTKNPFMVLFQEVLRLFAPLL